MEIEVRLPVTLHARPAAPVAAAAAKLGVRVQVGKDGKFVEARSLIGLLSLGAAAGDTLLVRADGPDGETAAEAVAATIRELRA